MNAAEILEEAPRETERSSVRLRAVSTVRSQTAFVRALLEEVERVVPPAAEGLRDQLADELVRLGEECFELAAALRTRPK